MIIMSGVAWRLCCVPQSQKACCDATSPLGVRGNGVVGHRGWVLN